MIEAYFIAFQRSLWPSPCQKCTMSAGAGVGGLGGSRQLHGHLSHDGTPDLTRLKLLHTTRDGSVMQQERRLLCKLHPVSAAMQMLGCNQA